MFNFSRSDGQHELITIDRGSAGDSMIGVNMWVPNGRLEYVLCRILDFMETVEQHEVLTPLVSPISGLLAASSNFCRCKFSKSSMVIPGCNENLTSLPFPSARCFPLCFRLSLLDGRPGASESLSAGVEVLVCAMSL